MNRKRILIFSLAYYPTYVGGAEVAIKEITARLSAADYDFSMITLGDGTLGETTEGAVRVYRVGNGIAKFLTMCGLRSASARDLPRLSKLFFIPLATMKAMVLHFQNPFHMSWSLMANQASASAWVFKWYTNFLSFFWRKNFSYVPFFLTLQEGDPIEVTLARVRWVSPFYKMMFKSAECVQVISHYLKSFAVSVMGVKRPVSVVPNGFDRQIFFPPKDVADKAQSRQRLFKEAGWEIGEAGALHTGAETGMATETKKEKDPYILITTSRLVPKNGIEYVIRALPALHTSGIPAKFFIIGDGYLLDSLRQLVNELKVEKSVFFKGFVPYEKLADYVRGADAFIRPSLSEGLGNSFIEAAACGLPLIATPVGGIVDFLRDPVSVELASLRRVYGDDSKSPERNGVACIPRDADSITTAVGFLFNNPKVAALAGQGALITAEHYSWDTIAQKMDALFKQTIPSLRVSGAKVVDVRES